MSFPEALFEKVPPRCCDRGRPPRFLGPFVQARVVNLVYPDLDRADRPQSYGFALIIVAPFCR